MSYPQHMTKAYLSFPQGTASSSAIINPQLAALVGQNAPRQSFIYTPPEVKPRPSQQPARQPAESRRSNPGENGGVPRPPQQEGPKMVGMECWVVVCVCEVSYSCGHNVYR